MIREIVGVEPLSRYLERGKAPTSGVTRSGGTVSGRDCRPLIPRRARWSTHPSSAKPNWCWKQIKRRLETAGSSLAHMLKCTIYCTSVDKFTAVNAVSVVPFPRTHRPESSRVFQSGPAFRHRNRLRSRGRFNQRARG
jgi:2-iminobutanoate/2-iminopropanoate deaminase